MMMLAGLAKEDMTSFIPGIGMMGYGQPHNTVKEVATKLSTRVLILVDTNGKRFILVHLEQAFVSIAIKQEVLKRLELEYPEWKIEDHNLLIIAQHTHSAPGGYSHYPFYNFTIPGFQTTVFEKVLTGIMLAIHQAEKNLAPAKLIYGDVDIHPDKEIAFNRSMKAHQNNPETRRLRADENHLAIDRTMRGLKILTPDGKLRAVINWFGVHATSISSFNNRIHYDNKGVAAHLFEKNYPGVMAFFAQECAGDVSPNFIWDKKTKLMRGKFSDQYENAEYNGELQFRASEKIEYIKEIEGEIKSFHVFTDMTSLAAHPAHGVAFFQGTLEGPGAPKPLAQILKIIARGVKKIQLIKEPQAHQKFYDQHDPKDVLLDHRTGAFLGIPLKVWKKLPPLPDPTVEFFRKDAKRGAIETLPWVPPILPFQLVIIGPLGIACVPGEITTTAGERLKQELLKNLKDYGLEEIVVSSYANAYMGYITTPEEYETQCYEGGHTVYGRNTLQGILTGFEDLASQASSQKQTQNDKPRPFHYPPVELAKRTVGPT